MESWDEARDDLEISRLTVENDRLCWQMDGLVDSDRCVEGVKDFRGPLLDLDNSWARLVVLHDDNTLCLHSMVDPSESDCLTDITAYHLLTTDPLRIFLVRQNGLAIRIYGNDVELPVECPDVQPGDIDSIVHAGMGNQEFRQLDITYIDKSSNEQQGACEVMIANDQDNFHFTHSWQRIPNSNRYLLTPFAKITSYILRNEDEVIELNGQSDGLVAFHPSGDFFVTGEKNGIINLWDSLTGALLHSFPAHSGSISTLQVNETSIVSATDNEIKIWRLVTDIDDMLAAARDMARSYP
jgi:WD40 repeat protein